MKSLKFFLTALAIFIAFSKNFGWGEKGHFLIARHSFKVLHYEMIDFLNYADFVIERSADADKRRSYMPDEYPKHFIDIDFYQEFIEARMITCKDSLKKVYGDSIVTQMGLLPWTTLESYNNLVKAFSSQNIDSIIFYAADLSHYVADGFQPMHATINYDGQLTNQKGIHSRYESVMFNKYINIVDSEISPKFARKIDDVKSFIFNYIYASSVYASVVFEADSIAKKIYASRDQNSSNIYDDLYYEILWFRTKDLTIQRAERAAEAIASLYYTAWIEAGKPKLSNPINYFEKQEELLKAE